MENHRVSKHILLPTVYYILVSLCSKCLTVWIFVRVEQESVIFISHKTMVATVVQRIFQFNINR